MKSPIFVYFGHFLGYFGHFLGTFLIQPVSMIPWLLNWIIYWIESPQLFLNWIIVWIEFWETNIESNIELNPILPKFKLWIESFWVSIMAILTPGSRYIKDIWRRWTDCYCLPLFHAKVLLLHIWQFFRALIDHAKTFPMCMLPE